MQEPPKPLDETMRLVSLQSLRLLDSAPEERFDRITRMVQRLFGVDICLVSLVDSERQWFKSKQGLEVCETSRRVSFCGHAILNEEALIVEDTHKDERFADNPLVTDDPVIRFYAGYPLHGPEGYRIGTLCLIHSAPRAFSEDDTKMLVDFAALVDDELRASTLVNVDELTGIANRRGFMQVANHVLPLCLRNNLGAELLFFDLDGFKAINDECGHEAGDKALRAFAKLLLKVFRTSDVVARLGGDEFAVLLVGKTGCKKGALSRLGAEDADPVYGTCETLRWSVGNVAFDPARHSGIEDLLREADERMYEAKRDNKKKSEKE